MAPGHALHLVNLLAKVQHTRMVCELWDRWYGYPPRTPQGLAQRARIEHPVQGPKGVRASGRGIRLATQSITLFLYLQRDLCRTTKSHDLLHYHPTMGPTTRAHAAFEADWHHLESL